LSQKPYLRDTRYFFTPDDIKKALAKEVRCAIDEEIHSHEFVVNVDMDCHGEFVGVEIVKRLTYRKRGAK
jgi:hypothetical protein